MAMKATSSTDHSRGSWNEDRVTVFFGMKTVIDISLALGALGVVSWQCGVIVGFVIVDDYWIMKGADWGSRSQMV